MVMTDSTAVAANSTSANVLAGKMNEFLSENSVIRIYVTGGGSDIFASLLVGAEALIDDQLVSPLTTFPKKPDDLLTEGAGFAGDRLTLRYRNSNAASRTVQTRIEVEPL
tara:strand:+ start:887 stop:1216 length:330 start_codon:yes stop_codon:yes gene_type:complete